MILRNYIQIFRKNEKNTCWVCGCFLPTYTLENYSDFKNKFLFNNGSILEMIIIKEAGEI